MNNPDYSKPARNANRPERRHVAGLHGTIELSRQHAGAPAPNMTRRSFLSRTALAAGGTACLLNTNWRALAADGAAPDPVGDLSPLANSHDLRLPLWGNYTKTYNGISHVADLERGMRFDLSVFPGHYRREVMVPNVNWEGGFHPWDAAPDMSFYSYRYELEWKDRVYCDVSFSTLSDRSR